MAENGHGVRAQSVQAWVIEDECGLYRARGKYVYKTNELLKARIYSTEGRAWAAITELDVLRAGDHARPVIISLD